MAKVSIPKRGVAVGTAVFLAAIATVALLSYVRGLEADVAGAYESVQAYVAKATIPEGTSGDAAAAQGMIVREDIPRRLLAAEAVASLDQISGHVASADVLPGEQIVATRFVSPDERRTELLDIPAGLQAMSVEVGVPAGVAQFVQPGSRISVIAQLPTTATVPAEGQPPAPSGDVQARYLLQGLEVLAIGQRAVGAPGSDQVEQDQGRVLVTLAVTPEQAEQLALAVFQGQLYLTLQPAGQEPVETRGATLGTVFDGS